MAQSYIFAVNDSASFNNFQHGLGHDGICEESIYKVREQMMMDPKIIKN